VHKALLSLNFHSKFAAPPNSAPIGQSTPIYGASQYEKQPQIMLLVIYLVVDFLIKGILM